MIAAPSDMRANLCSMAVLCSIGAQLRSRWRSADRCLGCEMHARPAMGRPSEYADDRRVIEKLRLVKCLPRRSTHHADAASSELGREGTTSQRPRTAWAAFPASAHLGARGLDCLCRLRP